MLILLNQNPQKIHFFISSPVGTQNFLDSLEFVSSSFICQIYPVVKSFHLLVIFNPLKIPGCTSDRTAAILCIF